MIVCGLIFVGIVMTSCKKEHEECFYQNYKKKTIKRQKMMADNPRIIKIIEFHKEGGRRFLGFIGQPRYREIDKNVTISTIGEYEYHHVFVSCVGEGHAKCSEKLSETLGEEEANVDVEYIQVDDYRFVNENEIVDFVDNLIEEIDESIGQGFYNGNIQRDMSFISSSGEEIMLCFEGEWINGNEDGDADIRIVVSNPNLDSRDISDIHIVCDDFLYTTTVITDDVVAY